MPTVHLTQPPQQHVLDRISRWGRHRLRSPTQHDYAHESIIVTRKPEMHFYGFKYCLPAFGNGAGRLRGNFDRLDIQRRRPLLSSHRTQITDCQEYRRSIVQIPCACALYDDREHMTVHFSIFGCGKTIGKCLYFSKQIRLLRQLAHACV